MEIEIAQHVGAGRYKRGAERNWRTQRVTEIDRGTTRVDSH